jgi:hypothetical protein
MRQDLANKNDGEEPPMYQIKGVLRRGEKQSFWKKRLTWLDHANFNFVDLFFMARLFRFLNMDSASFGYLEFIADEAAEDVYPIPATKETFKV